MVSEITAEGEKYLRLSADSERIYGKKGTSGIVCVKTAQTIIVGLYKDPIKGGNAHRTVEKLAEFLSESGY